MAEEIQYTANTGMVTISSANSNLDGSGDIYKVLVGAANGTVIKTVTIKAITSTKKGMVRLFVSNSTKEIISLIAEIDIDAIIPSATEKSFERAIYLDLSLSAGYMLVASTQNPDSFNIIAEGLDRSYYSLFRTGDTTQYAGNTGIGQVSVANPNLDGSGTLTNILTSDSVLGDGFGCSIKSITIKGIGKESTEGMIRIFIGDGKEEETLYLFLEVPIVYIVPGASTRSLVRQLNIQTSFSFQAGYNIYVSTENAEGFSIMADANDWTYFA